MTDEEGYIPYLVLVRFDKDGGDLKARVIESAPALKDVLGKLARCSLWKCRTTGQWSHIS